MSYNLKTIRKKFKEQGIFYTPPELVELLKSYAPKDVHEVYDPTCGDGGLLYAFGEGVKKYGQELDPTQAEVAKEGGAEIVVGDTLAADGFPHRKFDLIMANPPFSVQWTPREEEPFNWAGEKTTPTQSKADYAFNLHILNKLSDTGVAVVMNSPGVLFRGSREGKIRQWLVEQNWIERVVHIPGDKFVDTKIPTCVIIYRKNKENTDIIFEDTAQAKERVVPLSEIKENDYNLSVLRYIEPEYIREEEPVDIFALEREIREHELSSIRQGLEMHKTLLMIKTGEDRAAHSEALRKHAQQIIEIAQEYLDV